MWGGGGSTGTPDAICFSVDKPSILIAGFCVYGGVGYYNYELELLDGVSFKNWGGGGWLQTVNAS